MAHPIIQDLEWRHSCKKYDASKKISEENLDILFKAMRLSASSINSQPWRFVVIESEKAKQRLFDTFAHSNQFNQHHVFECSHIILFGYNPFYTRENYAEVVDKGIQDKRTPPEDRESAFGGFVFAGSNTDESGNNGCWTKAQMYLAFGNALHTLARLRIDSTPLEGIDVEQVNKAFTAELAGHQCDVALAIGYRHLEEDYNAKLPKSRHSLESIMVRI